MMGRIAPMVAVALTAGFLLSGAARAETEIKLPIKVSAETLRGKLMTQFGEEVAKATNGEYKVVVYPSGQLYEGTAAVKAVRLGNVQMTTEPNSGFSGYTKSVELMELPFAFAKPQEFHQFLSGPRAAKISQELEKSGFEVLSMFDEGPFVIATKAKLATEPADLKGLKIRTSGHEVVVKALRAMGASTVKIPYSEMYSALQQGTIDAIYTTFDAYTKDKFWEVAPHVMIFPSYGAYMWVANKAWWDKQPGPARQSMKQIAEKLAKQYDKAVWDEADDYVKTLKANGGDYFDPTEHPEAVKKFRAAVQPAIADLRKQFGDDTVNALLSN
jgi:tripartite ATP-independent transporter DctP family solute receptor